MSQVSWKTYRPRQNHGNYYPGNKEFYICGEGKEEDSQEQIAEAVCHVEVLIEQIKRKRDEEYVVITSKSVSNVRIEHGIGCHKK